MQHPNRWFTLVMSMSLVLLGVLALLVLAPHGVSQATVLLASTPCEIRLITITALLGSEPGISDTAPYTGISRTVYYASPSSSFSGTVVLPGPGGTITLPANGIITLTTLLDVSSGDCYLYGGIAFGNPITAQFRLSQTTPLANIPYAVSDTNLTTQIVQVDATSSPAGTGVMPHPQAILTFVPSGTQLVIISQTISTTFPHLYPAGTTLYYTDTHGVSETFTIQGHSTDQKLQRTSFQPVNLGCNRLPPPDNPNPDWSAEYCLLNIPEPPNGTIAVTSYYTSKIQVATTFNYRLDSVPPTAAIITSHLPMTWSGPIPLTWHASDAESGLKDVTLWYSATGTGISRTTIWDSGKARITGTTNTYTFTPPTYDQLYWLAVTARDNVGNDQPAPPVAQAQVFLESFHVFLPLVLREYVPFVQLSNSDFSQDLAGWTISGSLGVYTRTDPSSLTNTVALLGNPAYPCRGGVPVGYAGLSQTFTMPSLLPGQSSSVTFRYRIYSNDRNSALSDRYDLFDVLLNDNRVFRDANTQQFNYCNVNPYDLGWKTKNLPVSGFDPGQQVGLNFRVYNQPDGWYNTYVLLDDVRLIVSP